MRAISVRMPFAWALLHGKPVENRDRRWPLGEYALHASKLPPVAKYVPGWFQEDWYECSRMSREAGLVWTVGTVGPISYQTMLAMSGAIIGVIEVVDCVTSHPSPFYVGPYGLVIKQETVIALPRPVPCKGALGAWVVPEDIERQVREQLR